MSDKMEIEAGSLSPAAALPEPEQQPEQPQGSIFRFSDFDFSILQMLQFFKDKFV
jgi:hypothetical protein